MRARDLFSLLAAGSLLGACGSSSSGGDDDPTPDGVPAPDADTSGFTTLVGRDWTIPPGGDSYRCIRIPVEEDILITSFRALAPLGTHHTVLTYKPSLASGDQVGEYDCDANDLDTQMLFASGVGTDDLAFPEGVAIRVPAGSYLNLNLHLFNATPSEMTGLSAIQVLTVPTVDPGKEAEMVFAGTFSINIPGNTGGTPYQTGGGCTFQQPATLLAYWPHMHQFAVRQKVELTLGGTTTTLHDEAFNFEEQRNYPLDPNIEINPGDSIDVTCYYENATGTGVGFGDSSNQEMCFTGLYRYPKQATFLFECATGGL